MKKNCFNTFITLLLVVCLIEVPLLQQQGSVKKSTCLSPASNLSLQLLQEADIKSIKKAPDLSNVTLKSSLIGPLFFLFSITPVYAGQGDIIIPEIVFQVLPELISTVVLFVGFSICFYFLYKNGWFPFYLSWRVEEYLEKSVYLIPVFIVILLIENYFKFTGYWHYIIIGTSLLLNIMVPAVFGFRLGRWLASKNIYLLLNLIGPKSKLFYSENSYKRFDDVRETLRSIKITKSVKYPEALNWILHSYENVKSRGRVYGDDYLVLFNIMFHSREKALDKNYSVLKDIAAYGYRKNRVTLLAAVLLSIYSSIRVSRELKEKSFTHKLLDLYSQTSPKKDLSSILRHWQEYIWNVFQDKETKVSPPPLFESKGDSEPEVGDYLVYLALLNFWILSTSTGKDSFNREDLIRFIQAVLKEALLNKGTSLSLKEMNKRGFKKYFIPKEDLIEIITPFTQKEREALAKYIPSIQNLLTPFPMKMASATRAKGYTNEDAYLMADWGGAVFDGMGGMQRAEYASHTLKRLVNDEMRHLTTEYNYNFYDELKRKLKNIRYQFTSSLAPSDAGSTAVMAIIYGREIYIANAGDSVAYHFEYPGILHRLTQDNLHNGFHSRPLKSNEPKRQTVINSYGSIKNGFILLMSDGVENSYSQSQLEAKLTSLLFIEKKSIQETVNRLVWDAKHPDDRTAVLIRLEETFYLPEPPLEIGTSL